MRKILKFSWSSKTNFRNKLSIRMFIFKFLNELSHANIQRIFNTGYIQHCNVLEITREKLEQLPASVALLLLAAVSACRQNPPPDWNEASYSLVGREDLATLCRPPTIANSQPQQNATASPQAVNTEASSEEAEDGMEQLDSEVR